MFRALLVGNDGATLEVVEQACRDRGYAFGSCATCQHADSAFKSGHYDLAIIDWPSPGSSEFCARLRSQLSGADFYILALIRGDATQDRANILAAGADDYLTKPLDLSRLSLRLSIAERNIQRIVAQQRAEESLRETAEQLALAATGTNDGFWYAKIGPGDWHRPSAPVWYSPKMKAMLGFAEHEFKNVLESWSERLHPDDRARVYAALEEHFGQRAPYDIEYRLRIRSGEYRWFCGRGQAQWDAIGQPTRIAGSIRDVTERHLFDEALRESESRHRLVAETVNDIIWEAGWSTSLTAAAVAAADIEQLGGMTLTYVSPAIERVLGYSPIEARQLPLRRMLTLAAFEHAMAVLQQELREDIQTPNSMRQRTLELEHVTKAGGSCLCEVRCVFVRDPDGHPTGVLGVSRDITERKRGEDALNKERAFLRQLVEAHERDRQLFAYEIHDGVVQHLTASLMHLDVVNESQESISELTRNELVRGLKLLRSAVREGRRLIGGLRPPILDESGIVAAIEYLINENRESLSEAEFVNESCFKRLAPPLENALFRVVQEALNNVRRHSCCERAQVRLLQGPDWVRVEVRDWGVGFDPDRVRDDRFGLQGIRERARLFGGQATIESSPGEGARVCVQFPLLLAN